MQNCSPTNAWLREAIGVTRRLLNPENAKKIRAQVLLIQAGLDSIVCLPEQDQFVALVPGARILKLHDAKHEIYCCHDAVMERYVTEILSFFGA